jgi:hypothetical protein
MNDTMFLEASIKANTYIKASLEPWFNCYLKNLAT